jgi:hypothetical protein
MHHWVNNAGHGGFASSYDFSSWSGAAVPSMSMKHALIMDEVDGMAGSEDRGGIQVMKTPCFLSFLLFHIQKIFNCVHWYL